MDRLVLQPQPGLGDDADRAFRADDEAVRARPRAAARQAAALHGAGRRHRAQRLHEIVDMGVEHGEMAAGAGRDHAADRRHREALREMAQGEAVGLQRRFEIRHPRAAADARGAGRPVDLGHAGHAHRGQRDRRRVAVADLRLDAADHRAAAAERDQRRPGVRRPVHDRQHLLFGLREGDDVGNVGRLPVEHAHGVGQRLAHGVDQPCVGIARADRFEGRRRRQPGGGQVELVLARRRPVRETVDAQRRAVGALQVRDLRLRRALAFPAPAPEFQPSLGHAALPSSVSSRPAPRSRRHSCPKTWPGSKESGRQKPCQIAASPYIAR